jgi:hypothetical protein
MDCGVARKELRARLLALLRGARLKRRIRFFGFVVSAILAVGFVLSDFCRVVRGDGVGELVNTSIAFFVIDMSFRS